MRERERERESERESERFRSVLIEMFHCIPAIVRSHLVLFHQRFLSLDQELGNPLCTNIVPSTLQRRHWNGNRILWNGTGTTPHQIY